jgi:hypothetical protein
MQLLLSAGSGGTNGQSSKTKVNFIEGSVVNGVNVLTTKYTDFNQFPIWRVVMMVVKIIGNNKHRYRF